MILNPYGPTLNIAGRNVRKFRLEQGLSQEEFAAKLQLRGYSIGQKAISRMETGDRVIADYEIVLLAKVLGVSPMDLLE